MDLQDSFLFSKAVAEMLVIGIREVAEFDVNPYGFLGVFFSFQALDKAAYGLLWIWIQHGLTVAGKPIIQMWDCYYLMSVVFTQDWMCFFRLFE